jgi:hypothetical protein
MAIKHIIVLFDKYIYSAVCFYRALFKRAKRGYGVLILERNIVARILFCLHKFGLSTHFSHFAHASSH